MCIGCALEIYIWLSNKVAWNIHIGDTLNYLNSRCNTAKLLWVVIYVVCYGRFSPDLVVINICRQRLIKVKSPLWQRSLANENAVVCRQGAMRWRLNIINNNFTLSSNLNEFLFFNFVVKWIMFSVLIFQFHVLKCFFHFLSIFQWDYQQSQLCVLR